MKIACGRSLALHGARTSILEAFFLAGAPVECLWGAVVLNSPRCGYANSSKPVVTPPSRCVMTHVMKPDTGLRHA